MSEVLSDRLGRAFPPVSDAPLIRGVREGILLADKLAESEPLLRTLIGRDLRGHLRRAGVLFRISDLCLSGDLPFMGEIAKMPCGNWHWLELGSGEFLAHVCRTESAEAFPVDAQSRQDARLTLQPDLLMAMLFP